jgi:hypothetical protein
VLNSIPNWFVIFAATMIVAASTKAKVRFPEVNQAE